MSTFFLDSRPLADIGQVLTRTLERARSVLEQTGGSNPGIFQNYTQAAKAKAPQISETVRRAKKGTESLS